jgi:hypothetical protein
MLYLAEVKKKKEGLLGGSKTELKLLACQSSNKSWSPVVGEKKIGIDEAHHFGNGALVTVNFSKNWQIQGKLESASHQLVKLLQDTAVIWEKFKNQQEEIEHWKQSLSYQLEELNRREEELERRLEQIEQMEEELKLLQQQYQVDNGTREEVKKIIASRQPLGVVLQQADLVSANQIEVALKHQSDYPNLRIGEILALRGWIKLETADFFSEHWSSLVQEKGDQPLGYYLKKAALLDEEQIDQLLNEQTKLGAQIKVKLRLGAIAVLKGWLKQTTLDYFLEHLFPESQSESPLFRIEERTNGKVMEGNDIAGLRSHFPHFIM